MLEDERDSRSDSGPQAVERPSQDERHWRLAMDVARLGTWDLEVATNIVISSPELATMFGGPDAGKLSQNADFTRFIHPDDLPGVQAAIEEAVASNSTYHHEFRVVWSDGSVHWLEGRGEVFCDPDGQPERLVGISADITERKRVEEALRQSEERMELALQGADLGTWDWNVQTGELVYNERWADMLGYTLEEIEPNVGFWESLVHPDDLPHVVEALARHLNGETEFYETEHRVLHNSGHWVWILDKGRVIERAQNGTPLRACGTHLDVTERKMTEEDLKAAQIIAKSGSWRWNLQTNEVVWSDNLCRIHGLPPGSKITFDLVMSLIHPEDLDEVQQKIQRMLDQKKTMEFEYRIITPEGEEKSVRGAQKFAFDQDGNLLRLIGTVQDITERKQAEAARRKLEAQVQHAQKLESLGMLAGGIAHDFNNLLTSILGYSDLARMELPPDSPSLANINEVMKGARRAAELTQQMLAYSGKGRFVVRPLDLSVLVGEMSRLLKISISKKCVLQHNLAPNLPPFDADATQIQQVIMNLILNASEAIGDRIGGIAISTGLLDCDRAYLTETYLDENLPEGSYVYLEVTDTGEGMSEETLAKIFDPFFTTKFTGRGLGLAAVLGIVRGHGGALKVQSELGVGTNFRVHFPVSRSPAAPESAPEIQPGHWRASGTVLIIDDEESVRRLAGQMLQTMGFDVLTANDGREGVEVFRREADRIRLVLLDMTMPYMDGKETFRELQHIHGNVKTILSSGYTEQTTALRFAGEGLSGFIQKPYRFEQLRAAVRSALE